MSYVGAAGRSGDGSGTGASQSVCGSPSQHPSLKWHVVHCHVP